MTVGAEFEAFWRAYPRKKSKGAACKAFDKARDRASFEEIMEGLGRARFSPDPQFRPYPATWLNRSCWEDEEEDLTLDPWGLLAWYGAQPVSVEGLFWVRGWEFDAFSGVLLATEWEFDWRGDLETLGAWVVDGLRPDSIADVILSARSRAARLLRGFDGLVRRHALRWSVARCEWVRG